MLYILSPFNIFLGMGFNSHGFQVQVFSYFPEKPEMGFPEWNRILRRYLPEVDSLFYEVNP